MTLQDVLDQVEFVSQPGETVLLVHALWCPHNNEAECIGHFFRHVATLGKCGELCPTGFKPFPDMFGGGNSVVVGDIIVDAFDISLSVFG